MERRLSKDEVLEYFGISSATLYRWIRAGRIAAPVRLGQRTYWYLSSIQKTESYMRRCSEENLLRPIKNLGEQRMGNTP